MPLLAEEILTLSNGKKITIKDNYTWKYVTSNKPSTIKYAEEAVTIWDKSLLRKDKDYSKALGLFLHYQNHTNKKIIGVVTQVSIINPFGKQIFKTTYEDEVVLKPSQRIKNNQYWVYKDNQFVSDEPYDRMWQMADNGTAKIKTKITKVIFEDGTILKAKPSKPRK